MLMRDGIQISSEDKIAVALLSGAGEVRKEKKERGGVVGTDPNTPQEDHLAIDTAMNHIVDHRDHWRHSRATSKHDHLGRIEPDAILGISHLGEVGRTRELQSVARAEEVQVADDVVSSRKRERVRDKNRLIVPRSGRDLRYRETDPRVLETLIGE
jgi:hypothetical protein